MKTKTMNKWILGIVSTMLWFNGCSSGTPSCSDGDVKELVLDISIKEGKNQMTMRGYDEMVEEIQNDTGNDENIKYTKDIVDRANKAFDGTQLTAIRLDSEDDKTQKVSCKGQLLFPNKKTHDIRYTAQYTEDGQLFVEVYGL